MVTAAVLAGALDRLDVVGLLDDADLRVASRRGSVQISHGSMAVIELQTEQWKSFSLTSMTASASAAASSLVTFSRWCASRVAVFLGRRPGGVTAQQPGATAGLLNH